MNWLRQLFRRSEPRVDLTQEMLKLKIEMYQDFYRRRQHEPCTELDVVRRFLTEHNAIPE
jgi:hypothetical protein